MVRLQSGEPGPQASRGDEHRALIPYNPQIASARNRDRGGGREHRSTAGSVLKCLLFG